MAAVLLASSVRRSPAGLGVEGLRSLASSAGLEVRGGDVGRRGRYGSSGDGWRTGGVDGGWRPGRWWEGQQWKTCRVGELRGSFWIPLLECEVIDDDLTRWLRQVIDPVRNRLCLSQSFYHHLVSLGLSSTATASLTACASQLVFQTSTDVACAHDWTSRDGQTTCTSFRSDLGPKAFDTRDVG